MTETIAAIRALLWANVLCQGSVLVVCGGASASAVVVWVDRPWILQELATAGSGLIGIGVLAALAAVLIGLGAWMLPTARGIRIGAVGTALGAVSSAALWILTVSVLHQGEVVAIPLGVPGVFAVAATAALLWLGTLGPTVPREKGANESDPAGSSPAKEG